MKPRFAAAPLFLAALVVHGAPANSNTDVHLRADRASPVIGQLRAGEEPVPATDALPNTPAGWMAVEVPGPFDVFVANADMTKALGVQAGAPLLLEPSAGAPVLASMMEGDSVEIMGLRGRWTQVRIQRDVVGYVLLDAIAPSPAPLASTPAPAPSLSIAPPPELVQAAQVPSTASMIGSPVTSGSLSNSATEPLPRTFQGKFASSQRPFMPRRPYDYQLNDDAGIRIAYVDLSRLMLTEQPENYLGRIVVVNGTAEYSDQARAIVIHAEGLILR